MSKKPGTTNSISRLTECHEVLTGFLSEDGDAFGRPVGVAMDKQGALLVADDVGNAIWRVRVGR